MEVSSTPAKVLSGRNDSSTKEVQSRSAAADQHRGAAEQISTEQRRTEHVDTTEQQQSTPVAAHQH
jgi:hypothetical protein